MVSLAAMEKFFVPSVSTTAPAPAVVSPPSPLYLNDEYDEENDMFEGVDLDHVLGGEEELKEKRSARAKRRRAKMNTLFNSLASDVGLPPFADRARVLERTREVLRELRDAKKMKMDVSMSMPPPPIKPVVSILDVVSEHLYSAKNEIVTHSPCA
jgi:hypothetical protein